jgi:hypothetical protein
MPKLTLELLLLLLLATCSYQQESTTEVTNSLFKLKLLAF